MPSPNKAWNAIETIVVGRSPTQEPILFAQSGQNGLGYKRPVRPHITLKNGLAQPLLPIGHSAADERWHRVGIPASAPENVIAMDVLVRLSITHGSTPGGVYNEAGFRAPGEAFDYGYSAQSVASGTNTGDRNYQTSTVPVVDGEFEFYWWFNSPPDGDLPLHSQHGVAAWVTKYHILKPDASLAPQFDIDQLKQDITVSVTKDLIEALTASIE